MNNLTSGCNQTKIAPLSTNHRTAWPGPRINLQIVFLQLVERGTIFGQITPPIAEIICVKNVGGDCGLWIPNEIN